MNRESTNIRQINRNNISYLFDASLIDDIDDVELFNSNNNNQNESESDNRPVRGSGIFFTYHNLALVLKHYQRGGFIAKWLYDKYFGRKLEFTRAFMEWRLLQKMRELDLPSPIPVAARVIRKGIFYQADLITQEIEQASTLSDKCMEAELDEALWQNIGRCIKKFHDNDVFHADLNARNILIDNNNAVYLIDFDKSYFRYMGDSWKVANLNRLHRSLSKFLSIHPGFHFKPENWKQLLAGYNAK